MTDTTLEDRVVAFITERGGGVSFVELEREFPGEFEGQKHGMYLTGCDNVVLWEPVSLAMTGVLNSARDNGRIVMKPASELVYFLEGKVFNLPVARKARRYATPRWLPVTFSPARPGDRKDCGDSTSRTADGRRW